MKDIRKVRLSALDVSLIAVGAAIYGLGLMSTVWVTFIPGVSSFRWCNFLPMFLGILFGPFIGGLGAGLGNFLNDVLGLGLTPSSTWGFTTNWFQAYICAKFIKDPRQWWKVLIVSGVTGFVMVGMYLAGGLQFFGVLPIAVWLALQIPVLLPASYVPQWLAPVFTRIFAGRAETTGLYWRKRLPVKETSSVGAIAVLLVSFAVFLLVVLYPVETAPPSPLGPILGVTIPIVMLAWVAYDGLRMEGRI
jgi:uncharacterized membrane protein